MDKLTKLLARCKCGVHLTVNEHRNVYESAKKVLDSPEADDWEISNEVRLKIIETNTLISIVFYPDTPIGFYHVLHYDIDAALDEALECLDDDGSVITP